MLKEILEACWPVILFLGMAYCSQGFSDPEPDKEWNDIGRKSELSDYTE